MNNKRFTSFCLIIFIIYSTFTIATTQQSRVNSNEQLKPKLNQFNFKIRNTEAQPTPTPYLRVSNSAYILLQLTSDNNVDNSVLINQISTYLNISTSEVQVVGQDENFLQLLICDGKIENLLNSILYEDYYVTNPWAGSALDGAIIQAVIWGIDCKEINSNIYSKTTFTTYTTLFSDPTNYEFSPLPNSKITETHDTYYPEVINVYVQINSSSVLFISFLLLISVLLLIA